MYLLFCDRISALPALLYYAQHGYCEQEEVDVQMLKRNFGTSIIADKRYSYTNNIL
jgi:hypothetical protein